MDDGLQHYELQKDFSIVCQKSQRFELDHMLPKVVFVKFLTPILTLSCSQINDAWVKREWEGVQDYYL